MTEDKAEVTEVEWENEKLKRANKVVLEINPYDMEAWSVLIREAQQKWVGDMRPFYEQLIVRFPTSGRYWRIYIDQEIRARNLERVEKLFQRCLMKVLNIELWKVYITYIKETKGSIMTGYKEKMAQAYDFTLEKMGMDIQSYSIWNDYVMFLKNVDAVGSYAENQRISAVRKVYQRGVVNPMTNIEQFWKDYIAFEQGINPIIAEKMGMERSRDYMNARRVAKEFEAVTRGINRNIPSIPPTGSNDEIKQVEQWKKYIAWEKSNPLRTEDQTLITKRVMFAYEQCLLCMGHHPDIWYEAALFLEHSSKLLTEKGDVTASKIFSDEAGSIYERAITGVLNKNMLLYFAYADFEEGRMKYEKVHQIYSRLLEIPDIDPSLAYIQYMKFARRAEGIKSARTIFKKAREDVRSTYHVFVSAALMEYYCSKDKNIAFRIFELGLKKFGDTPDYISAYIDYLSHLNEDNNTRVLFERVLTSGTLEPDKSVEIWNRFLEFESNVGDLASIVKVEKRRSAVLEKLKEYEDKETAQLVDRYKFLDLFPCSPAELRAIGYSQSNKIGPHKGLISVGVVVEEEEVDNIPRPDFSQMIPYKPKPNPIGGEHPVAGGTFPFPPAVAHLCTLLPPPTSFRGPFVSVDHLIDIIEKFELEKCPFFEIATENGDTKLFDYSKSVHWFHPGEDEAVAAKRRKKALLGGTGEDSDDDEMLGAPPVNDIYRQRQQKRVK